MNIKKTKFMNMDHEYYDLMEHLEKSLSDDWNRIQKWVKQDPGTAGDQAELNWASILTNWLPANYHIVTKGRIINAAKKMSPQIDILVLHPFYPKALRDKKLYFSAGVAAAFECKLTLTRTELRKAINNSFEIKNLFETQNGSPFEELHQPILYGILAHSHDLKSKGEQLINSVFKRIVELTVESLHDIDKKNYYLNHPRMMTDLVSIADLGTFKLQKSLFIGQGKNIELMKKLINNTNDDCVATYYGVYKKLESTFQGTGIVLGSLINEIVKYFAYRNTSLRSFSEYLNSIYINLITISCNSIKWPKDVLSNSVLKKLDNKGYIEDSWSEWNDLF
ncbi:hypothetical protein JXQ31_12080 [candidate division KSB1 bacterium]|nr:hypothetical protein [candidate division KSB1 bacterium]